MTQYQSGVSCSNCESSCDILKQVVISYSMIPRSIESNDVRAATHIWGTVGG